MKKKILIVGSGMDVIDKPRGTFIDNYFDEVLIVKYSIYFLSSHKEYFGTPTIWVRPDVEWYRYENIERIEHQYIDNWKAWFNEDKQLASQQEMYDILSASSIKEVWSDDYMQQDVSKYFYDFTPPEVNKDRAPIIEIKKQYSSDLNMTTGMSAIMESIKLGYDVYYVGFDSHTKGYHYYHNYRDTLIPYKKNKPVPNMLQYKHIKRLESEKKLTHIDKIT